VKGLSRPQLLGGLLTVVVLSAITGGMLLLGPPSEERARQLDERRVQDLTSIAGAVDLYWTRYAKLPSSLDEVRQEPGSNGRVTDPGTNQPYEYRSSGANAYEVCARFDRDSPQRGSTAGNQVWSHGTGRQCFRREARKIS